MTPIETAVQLGSFGVLAVSFLAILRTLLRHSVRTHAYLAQVVGVLMRVEQGQAHLILRLVDSAPPSREWAAEMIEKIDRNIDEASDLLKRLETAASEDGSKSRILGVLGAFPEGANHGA